MTAVPSSIPDIHLNFGRYCLLTGGARVPGHPELCAIPMAQVSDPSLCYAGPNTAYWIAGTGCVWNAINSCVNLPTYKSWHYTEDDVVCVYDFSAGLCKSRDGQPGVVQPAPEIISPGVTK